LAYDQREKDLRKAEQKNRYDRFISNLEQLLHILRQPQYIIRVPVSNYDHQPIRHISESEMRDKMVRELSHLPNRIARVKLMDSALASSLKMETLPLPAGIPAAALLQRVAAIQAQNIAAGFLRDRKAVEQEINAHRKQWTQPKIASNIKPAMKLCPMCGAENNVEATTCISCNEVLATSTPRRRG